MKSIYLSGYSMALANGWPDMGFLTQTEVARIASMVASAVDIPVIADADDGYGNALSTIRTVQEFIKTGVAGIHLEDQRFPKRCGHIAGKTIVSLEEAVGKYRAALDTRDRLNPDFVDHRPHRRLRRGGRQPRGSDPPRPRLRRRRRRLGVVRAVERLAASPRWPSPRPCASRIRTCRWPSTTPRPSSGTRIQNPFTFKELGELGYKFIFITLFAAHAGMYAMWNAMEELVRDQEQAQWRLEKTKVGHPTESHHVMARVSHFQELEKKYIPGTEDRIKGSAGFDDHRMH